MASVHLLDQAAVEAFEKLDTTSVSDAQDRFGIPGGLHGINPVIPTSKMCGQAFTDHYIPCGLTKGTVGDFLDDVPPGQAVVIDDSGRTYCTVWGDLMTVTATRRQLAAHLSTVCAGILTEYSGRTTRSSAEGTTW